MSETIGLAGKELLREHHHESSASPLLRYFQFIIYSVLVTLISFWLGNSVIPNKAFNWDVIGYVGSALSLRIVDAKELQKATYKEIRSATTQDQYEDMVNVSDIYRHAVATDPISFSQQLPFYSGRILYTGAIFLSTVMGVNGALASKLISIISVLLIGILVFHWLQIRLSGILCLTVMTLLVTILEMPMIARLATPDSLSALVILLVAYLGLEKRKYWTAIAMVIGSLLVRSDNLIAATIFIMYFHFGRSLPLKQTVSALAMVGFAYLCVTVTSHHYGLQAVLHQTFLGGSIRPAEVMNIFGWDDYFRILNSNWSSPDMRLAEFFVLIGLAVFFSRPRFDNAMWIPLIVIPLHYLVFPALWPRLFFPFYILVFVIMIREIVNLEQPRDPILVWQPWLGLSFACFGLAIAAYPAVVSSQLNKPVLDVKLIYTIDELSNPRPIGTPWNDNTAIMNKQTGITVKLVKPRSAKMMDISFDHNDTYSVGFYNGQRFLLELVLKSEGKIDGLDRQRVVLPGLLTTESFDQVRILPLSGDNYYSVGHVILE